MSVAVTGLGVACPLGVGHETVWRRLLALEPALCDTPPSPAGLDVAPATAFESEFPAEDYAPPRKVRKCSNLARLAVVAAIQAIEHAKLPEDPALREGASVVLGTCFGSSDYYLQFHERIRRKGLKAANSVLFTEGVFNAASGHVCQILGLRGPSLAVVGGEEAGLSSLVTAADRLCLGSATLALAGGVEEFCDRVQGSLLAEHRVGRALGGLGGDAPGPFAEGAAVLCLEPQAAALARGANVFAHLRSGVRARPGAGDFESTEAPARAARAALSEANLGPSDIGLVVGGATGGPGARREVAALKEVFAEATPWYCAPGALVGEGFAFTSALLALVATQALVHQTVPPTLEGAVPLAPAGPLRLANAPQATSLTHVLVVSTSQPGGAVAIVLSAP